MAARAAKKDLEQDAPPPVAPPPPDLSPAERPEVTVRAGELAAAVKAAAGIVLASNTIPILANVRLIARDGWLEVTTTDLDCEFRTRVGIESGALATTVNAKNLAAVLAAVAGDAQARLKLEAGRLEVSAGRSRWALPVLPVDDFPTIVLPELAHRIELAGKELAAAIARVLPFVCTELSRYYICGMWLHEEASNAALVATNGHCLLRSGLPAGWPAGAEPEIVPTRFAQALERAAAAHPGPVVLEWGAKKLRAAIGDTVLVGKAIDGIFPDYRRVIPQPGEEPVAVDPAGLAGAVRRAALLANEKTRAVKIECKADRLVVSSVSPDSGSGCEEVPASCMAGHEAGFNSVYLQQMLTALGGETVEIHHADAGAPALLHRRPSDGAVGVVMPMRI
jgi:DNA polymerase-3 subunit beta